MPAARAEQARAVMIELFPAGFEELDTRDGVELVAYTTPEGEERLWQAFGGARASEVEEGWEDRWRRFHRPVRIGRFWIGPPWEQPDADAVAVVIDPGRAFGTGGHTTTRLCLELLVGLPPSSLLDVGCGSGVLSIAAAKAGFAPIVAVDVDASAAEATRRNAAANGVELDVRQADAATAELPPADLAVVNIALEPLGEIAPRLPCPRLVASGYLESDVVTLRGFVSTRRLAAEGWAADLFVRQ